MSNSKRTTDICRNVKVTINEVVDILVKIDTLLKTNNVHIVDLFNKDDIFDLRNVILAPAIKELLYYNFKNYTYWEFRNWIKKNIGYFNEYMNKYVYNNTTINSRCFDTKSTIINTSNKLFDLLNKTKRGNIIIVFERGSELCNKITYDKLLSSFELSDHKYFGHIHDIQNTPGNFILKIEIDNDSIKMYVEGLKDLFIYKASMQDFNIYNQNQNQNQNNNDYIWIRKDSLTNYRDDIKTMLESVMFACHYPIIIDKKTIFPLYTIKNINVNGINPLLKVNTSKNSNSNSNSNVNSDINALKKMLPDINWQSNVVINNTQKANVNVNSLNRQLPSPKFQKQKTNANANANRWNSFNSKLPQKNINNSQVERWAIKRGLPNLDKFKIRSDREARMNAEQSNNISKLNEILPTPRWPQRVKSETTQEERWMKY